MFTSKGSNSRIGLNDSEKILNPTNVKTQAFGKLKSVPLDGHAFSQPLYVSDVAIEGKGVHDVVYVATEHDSVYALDAEDGSVLWKRSFIDPANGIQTLDASFNECNLCRSALGAEIGVTSTPAIDPETGIMYVVSMIVDHGKAKWMLHALDLKSGRDLLGGPTEIKGSVAGGGVGKDDAKNIAFQPVIQNQRAGLALDNKVVYIAFGSYSDIGPYHGWLFAYDANALNLIDVFNTSPDSEGTAIWQSGTAPAIDEDGNIYVMTGDGQKFNAYQGGRNYGDSFIKLKLVDGKLLVLDYFTPYNEECLDIWDADLGSGSPALLPQQPGGRPHLLVAGSKEGRIYVLDRNSLGKYKPSGDTQIVHSLLINDAPCDGSGAGKAFRATTSKRIYGSPAYWNGNIYIGGAFGTLRSFQLNAEQHLQQTSQTATIFEGDGPNGRGPMAVVSSNGNSNAIVWAVSRRLRDQQITLHAYDATDLAKELYSSDFVSTDALPRSGTVFNISTVINGKVYVIAGRALHIFGLRK